MKLFHYMAAALVLTAPSWAACGVVDPFLVVPNVQGVGECPALSISKGRGIFCGPRGHRGHRGERGDRGRRGRRGQKGALGPGIAPAYIQRCLAIPDPLFLVPNAIFPLGNLDDGLAPLLLEYVDPTLTRFRTGTSTYCPVGQENTLLSTPFSHFSPIHPSAPPVLRYRHNCRCQATEGHMTRLVPLTYSTHSPPTAL